MPVYRYPNSPLIESVEVTQQPVGYSATIVMHKDAKKQDIEDLRAQLAKSFYTLADTVDGNTALQVRGIKNPDDLFEASGELGLTSETQKETILADKKKPASYGERIRRSSFFLSALLYDLGNIALIISGLVHGRHNPDGKLTSHDKSEIGIGAAFSLGDILMTAYGQDDSSDEFAAANAGLRKHLQKKNIVIPNGDALTPESLYKSGAIEEIHNWLHKNIGRIKCLTEFSGGLLTMYTASKPDNKNQYRFAAGLMLATGWAITFLLDKPRGAEIFNKSPPATLIGKITNNPRAWIARPLALANNAVNIWGAFNPVDGERKRTLHTKGKNDYLLNVGAQSSFLVAHTLFGMSGSKRPAETEDDKRMTADLVLLAANLLAKQPEPIRTAAIKEAAQYVATQLAHVTLNEEKVEKAIIEKVIELNQSSWLNKTLAATVPLRSI